MDSFDEQAREELSKLEAEAEEVRREMLPLQQRMRRIDAKIKALRSFLGMETRAKLSITDRIERVLQRAGEPLHYKEILKRLKTEEDFEPGGKRPDSGVLSKLSLDRFYRHDTGVYGLTEWREEETKRP